MRTVAAEIVDNKLSQQMLLSKLQVEVENTKITLKSVQRNYESLSSNFQQKQRECRELEALLVSERATTPDLLEELQEKDRQLAQSKERAASGDGGKAFKEQLEAKIHELGRSQKEVRGLQSDKAKLGSENKRLQKKMLEAESKYHIVAKNLKGSVEDNRLLQENIDNVLKEAEEWHKKNKESEALVASLRSENARILSERDKILSEKESLKRSMKESSSSVEKSLMDQERENVKLRHRIHDQDERAKVAETKILSFNCQVDSLEAELKAKGKRIDQLGGALNEAESLQADLTRALGAEKTLSQEKQDKIDRLTETLSGEKQTISDLISKKTEENSNLDVLSRRVMDLQEALELAAKKEEALAAAHSKQMDAKESEVRRGILARKKLKEEAERAREVYRLNVETCQGKLDRLVRMLDRLGSKIDSVQAEEREGGENGKSNAASSIVADLLDISEECLVRESELTMLSESVEEHFQKMQQWSASVCLNMQRVQSSASDSHSEETDRRNVVIQELQERLRQTQQERDEESLAAKSKMSKLSQEVESLKHKLDSSLSEQHQAVREMNDMMESERFSSKERMASLQRTIDELEAQFTAEKAASTSLLESEVAKFKDLHAEAAKKASRLHSELDEAKYRLLDLGNESSRISSQIGNISGDLAKYSEHLFELDLIGREDMEDMAGGMGGGSDGLSSAESPMNLAGQVFALRTKFLKMTQINQSVASKCKALQLNAN